MIKILFIFLIGVFAYAGSAERFKTDRTYVFVNVSDLKRAWFKDEDSRSKIIQDSLDTVRVKIDGTKAILKYKTAGGVPDQIKAISKTNFTHEEILTHIDNPINGWTGVDPEL